MRPTVDFESDADAAMAIGMDCEFMRINREIDALIDGCSDTSYGRGQGVILRRLKAKIILDVPEGR